MDASTITIAGNALIKTCITRNNGGAVFLNESSSFTVSGSAVLNENSAGGKGGCVYAEGDATAVTLEGACRLENVRVMLRAVCVCVCVCAFGCWQVDGVCRTSCM